MYAGSHDGRLWAVDAATGAARWKVRTTGPVHSTPLVSGGTVYVDSLDEHLYAVRAHRPGEAPAEDHRAASAHLVRTPAGPGPVGGTVRWRVPAPGAGHLTPAVAHGVVYQTTYRSLLALDAATGEERWRLETGGEVHSTPVVADGTVYVGSADDFLYAIHI
ncbi:putative pyrroloquinoline-quinone binding quinoprotein [Streptomyces sp. Ag109_O5-1]|nr:putative pyrroloquinoline-quinone binding quinoprotein [Streptomyces sp. Ag109_O5-1]